MMALHCEQSIRPQIALEYSMNELGGACQSTPETDTGISVDSMLGTSAAGRAITVRIHGRLEGW